MSSVSTNFGKQKLGQFPQNDSEQQRIYGVAKDFWL